MVAFCIIVFVLLLPTNHASVDEMELQNDTVVYEKWMKMDKMLKSFISSSIKRVLPSIMEFSSGLNISSDCMKQGFRLLNGIRKIEPWAITFIDASGKIIDGLLSSTTASFGDYDQCLDTVAKEVKQNKERILFRGQYCLAKFKPPLPAVKDKYFRDGIEELKNYTKSASGVIRTLVSKAHYFYVVSLHLGICVPSGCTLEDLNQVIHTLGNQIQINAAVSNCTVKQNNYFETGPITAISIYSVLGFLMLSGSILFFYYQKKKFQPQSKVLRILLAFSFQKNLKDFLKPDESKDNISCLNGIRFLTVTWILAGHTVFILSKMPQLHSHFDGFIESTKSFGMQIVINFLFSVDTFFLIAGLVNCYVAKKNKEKNKSRSFVYSIKHRLWRILPAYAAIMLSVQLIFSLASGPSMYTPFMEALWNSCQHNWWRNLLFINNYFKMEENCIPQTWYLSAEFQLFIIAAGTIRILLSYPKLGIILNSTMVLISAIYSAVWTELHGMHATLLVNDFSASQFDLMWSWYSQTMVHAGPYFIGVLVGYLLAEKKELAISKRILFFGWILSILMGTWIIFASWKWNNGVEPTKAEDILYSALSKNCFALAVAWTIICCSKGYGGLVNRILTWKPWTPLSKLVLCMYLISPMVQATSLVSSRTLRDSSSKEWVWRFFGDYFVSAFIAFVFYILVENPFLGIEKVLNSDKKEVPATNEGGSAARIEENPYKLETITTNGTGVSNSGYINS